MTPILELQNLTVRFGGLTAVDGVDFQVEPNQIFSVIGPNGAGKTTVFNAITGIYEPSAGTIALAGRDIRRPLTGKVWLACGLIGLTVGLIAGLLALNINGLWQAAIKRTYDDRDEPFTAAKAWQAVGSYWRGELALEHVREGRWSVVTADGERSVGHAKTKREAEALRKTKAELMQLGGREPAVEQQGDSWVVVAPGDNRMVASYPSETAARAELQRLAGLARQAATRRWLSCLALLLGTALGASGAYAVWNRARRTPDVIAAAGIARTFQNIRLFQDMTVIENVITAMDSRATRRLWRMALRTPGERRDEAAQQQQALELLAFVGVERQAQSLAKNLPYGDQRRLEIARALATGPKLVLLDEPAAGMNPSESVSLTGLIEQIRQRGIAVLLIEHHMRVVMGISDRIAVLDYGEKIAEGSPEEIRKNPKVIEAYLGSEAVG